MNLNSTGLLDILASKTWEELARVLDNDDWRKLGAHLGVSREEIEKISHAYQVGCKFSPSTQILRTWLNSNEATVESFLEALKTMNNAAAASFINTWTVDLQKKEEVLSALDSPAPWKWLKLFLVGDAGAGKSSVLRWLTGQKFDPTPSSTDGADVTTADVREWKRQISVDTTELLADCLTNLKKANSTHPQHPEDVHSPIFMPQTKNDEGAKQTVTQELVASINQYQQQVLGNELPWTFQVWDFSGTEVYYNTHHFFLSEAAIYLLIVDITRPVELLEERTKFWLRSIRSYAPQAPIIIIATHLDLISENEYDQKMLAIWRQYEAVSHDAETGNCFAVSCTSLQLLAETRELLQTTASEMVQKLNLVFPLRWMLFYHTLIQTAGQISNNSAHSSPLTYFKLEDVQIVARNCGLEISELQPALMSFHKLGFILYFPSDNYLGQVIFLKPQQLVDALRTVITVHKPVLSGISFKELFRPGAPLVSLNNDEEDLKSGKLTASRMDRIWSHYPPEVRLQLRALLQRFELAVPNPSPGQSVDNCDLLVPSLVEVQPTEDQDKKYFPLLFTYEISVTPPLGLLSRAIVMAINLAMKHGSFILCRLFRGGCTFRLENNIHCRMDVEFDSVQIRLQTVEQSKEVISFLESMDNFFEQQVSKFTRKAQCIDCKDTFETKTWRLRCLKCEYKRARPDSDRLIDLILNNKLMFDRLCRILDQDNVWKKFGGDINTPPSEILRLEQVTQLRPDFSPSQKILERWMQEENATVSNFLSIMKRIKCVTATQLIMEWTSQTYNVVTAIRPWKWLKLFLVGDAGAGKSSVLRWLTGQEFDPTPSSTNSAYVTTAYITPWKRHLLADQATTSFRKYPTKSVSETGSGIATEKLLSRVANYNSTVIANEVPLTFQVWDFGGQQAFEAHRFFLNEAAIYLLIVDITRPAEEIEERTKFWLRSIRSYAPQAPIRIIATHSDQISHDEQYERLFAIWSLFVEVDRKASNRHCFAVSCKSPDLLDETSGLLKETAEEIIQTFHMSYPLNWVLFYHTLLEETRIDLSKHLLTCLTFDAVRLVADTVGLNSNDLESALLEYHKLGFILYYPTDKHLSQMIFMQPQELVNILRAIASNYGTDGKQYLKELTTERIEQIWPNYSKEVYIQVRSILQHLAAI